MCTGRPGWQTISPQNMAYKSKMYPIQVRNFLYYGSFSNMLLFRMTFSCFFIFFSANSKTSFLSHNLYGRQGDSKQWSIKCVWLCVWWFYLKSCKKFKPSLKPSKYFYLKINQSKTTTKPMKENPKVQWLFRS